MEDLKVKYKVRFLEPAKRFLERLDDKPREKIFYNIWKSSITNDPELFKKLSGEIWEFRTRYGGRQYRLLAFWDRSKLESVLVIATHGFGKRTNTIPARDIDRAEQLRIEYYRNTK